jgi:hypothetical protein
LFEQVLAGKSFDASTSIDRRQQRYAQEERAFDLDAYMNDTYDPDDDVQSFLAFEAPWSRAAAASVAPAFSDEERDELQRLPRRSYVLTTFPQYVFVTLWPGTCSRARRKWMPLLL